MFLVDGNSLVARAWHANRHLITSDGKLSGGVYGALMSLQAARYSLPSMPSWDETIVLWDGGRSKRRMELYPEYKAGRKLSDPKTPEDVRDAADYTHQLAEVRRGISFLPCQQFKVTGVEADDLIAVFSRVGSDLGQTVIIFTGDHDMWVLTKYPNTYIYDAKRGKMGQDQVEKALGFPLEKYYVYKSLTGDSSDNIKGAKGVGPKTAMKWLPYLSYQDGKLISSEEVKGLTEDRIAGAELAYALIKLPNTLQELDLTPHQISELTVEDRVEDYPGLTAFFKEYELTNFLENMHLW